MFSLYLTCIYYMYQGMWYTMEKTQNGHDLSDRLIRSICSWHSYGVYEESEDIDDLIDMGADVNRMHGTILPLHCTCMVSDEESLLTLIKRGARVSFKKCLSIDIYLKNTCSYQILNLKYIWFLFVYVDTCLAMQYFISIIQTLS